MGASPPSSRAAGAGVEWRLVGAAAGRGEADDAEAAAFANSVMIRFLDANDTLHRAWLGHPSDMLGALVAAAECRERRGKISCWPSSRLRSVRRAGRSGLVARSRLGPGCLRRARRRRPAPAAARSVRHADGEGHRDRGHRERGYAPDASRRDVDVEGLRHRGGHEGGLFAAQGARPGRNDRSDGPRSRAVMAWASRSPGRSRSVSSAVAIGRLPSSARTSSSSRPSITRRRRWRRRSRSGTR